jgi:hypothetical protein
MSDVEHEHSPFVLYPLEIPLEEGSHVLGWACQIKVFTADGHTAILNLSSGDLNDWEALGMVRTHMRLLDAELAAAGHDPRD